MKRIFFLLIVALTMTCSQVYAKSSNYVFTGKDIYEACVQAVIALDGSGEYDNHRFGVCAGYIAGIVDFHTVARTVESLPFDMFCLPKNISTAQVIREVTRYLEANPDKLHDLAAYLVVLALHETYPCREEQGK